MRNILKVSLLAFIFLFTSAPGTQVGGWGFGGNPRPDSGGVAFEFAPASGQGMGTQCACTAITGSRGEAITVTRASVIECQSNDGQLYTQCGNNLPAVSSGIATSSVLGLWSYAAATNLALYSRDLSQADWVKTNATCAKTATGMRNDANSASTCTATAANGTALQTITVASALRTTSLHIKRRTGTGTVNVTRDNGTTWSDITASLSSTVWRRVVPRETPGCAGGNCIVVSAMSTASANPVIGIRLVTSGDAVDIDFVQDEAGGYATPPILTTTASATRALQTNTTADTGSRFVASGSTAATVITAWATAGFSNVITASSNGRYLYFASTTERMYDGVTEKTLAHGMVSGTERRYRSSWAGTTMTLYNVADATNSSGTFDGSMTAGTIAIAYSASSGALDGVLKLLCLDQTTRCLQ